MASVPKSNEPPSPKNNFFFFLKLKQYSGNKEEIIRKPNGNKAVNCSLNNSIRINVFIVSEIASPSIPSIKLRRQLLKLFE